MSTDIKLSKARLSKMIQQGEFCRGTLSSFGNIGKQLCKKAITNLAIPLATDYLPGLVSNLASKEIDKFERKAKVKRSWQSRKTIYLIHFK